MKRKIAIMVDSEIGWTEEEARKKGFNYVPIVMTIDGKEGYSGIDYPLTWIYDNLTSNTVFKTAASKFGMVQDEYRKALKTSDHVIFIPLSKHLSSQMNNARLAAEDKEFLGKVTVWESEFMGPWLLGLIDYILLLMNKNAEKEEFLKILDIQTNYMYAWIFPNSLERAYASGRMNKAQYMAGNLLKITPVLPIVNGSVNGTGMIKTRSKDKAIKFIVKEVCKKYDEFKAEGKYPMIITAALGYENEDLLKLEAAIQESGYRWSGRSWVPGAIVGHIGVGGAGAGITIIPNENYIPKEAFTKINTSK